MEIAENLRSIDSEHAGGVDYDAAPEMPPPEPRPSRWSRQRSFWLPMMALIVICLAWEYGVKWFDVSSLILPPLSKVVKALYYGLAGGGDSSVGGTDFKPHLKVTATEAFFGFSLGLVVGVVTGSLIAMSRTLELTFKPFIVAIYSTPKIALAPLFLVIFGFGMQSKVAVVFLAAWMPIFMNMVTGLKAIEPPRLELLRGMGASPLQTLLKVRLPMALPHLFSGIRVAILLSLLSAIAAEFVGAKEGLGYLMLLRSTLLDTASVYAIILLLMFLGIIMYVLTEWVQKRVLFWQDS